MVEIYTTTANLVVSNGRTLIAERLRAMVRMG
jgi:hypothetical protein